MDMNRSALLASALVVSFLLTPALAAAQLAGNQVFDYIWVKTFKFQPGWINNPNQLIVNAVIPTIAVYALFLGMTRALRVFQGMGSMEHVIALCVTFSGLLLGWIGWVAAALAFMGVWSVVLFIIMFVIGGALYTRGFFGRITAEHQLTSAYKNVVRNVTKKIESTESSITAMRKQYENKSNMTIGEAAKLSMKIADAEELAEKYRNQIRQMSEKRKDALAA